MENPGEYLKREREQRKVPLSKIAEATRVPLKSLEALEADDFDSLPHPTFVKGYIKSYCKVLGLDETDSVLRFELYLREKSGNAEEEQDLAGEKKASLGRFSPSGHGDGFRPSGPFSAGYVITALIVIAVVAVIYYYTSSPKAPEHISAPEPVASSENAASPQETSLEAKPEAVKTAEEKKPEKHESAAKEQFAGENHLLVVSATELTWVKIAIDDEEPFDVVLKAGEKVSWKASRVFSLVVGNAGGVSLTLDGEDFGPLGSSAEVVKLTLPKGAKVSSRAAKPAAASARRPIRAATTPAAGISASTAPSPREPKAVVKPQRALQPPLETGAGVAGTTAAEPQDNGPGGGATTTPKWDSTPQEKFEIRPVDETAD